ncbi:MAG: SpoIIE family protein phosphatase [Coriobacteriales bacterium]|nr:SpoIIE family protein phosphatase [Coriobacteriales bacterium]
MKLGKQGLATIGLIVITCLAAIQYVFLRNVPSTVSTFAFVCITNAIGLIVLALIRPKKLAGMHKTTMLKGAFFAFELTGFNVFLLLGSHNLDAVVISSVLSMYFVFITPLLLLLRKRVSFFSGIATVIAIIALLLLFGADTDALFSSADVVYLIIADAFFAAYVVSVSILGESEDSTHLTLAQMGFSALFALVGWLVECMVSGQNFALPTEPGFWVSAVFIGVFIRAVYGIVQISCQKYVSALKASLIFSSEIIVTLVTNPFMCNLLGVPYTPVTVFQILGGLLLIAATLMVDDTVMARLGYEDLQETVSIDASGTVFKRTSVTRKVILLTLSFAMITLVLCASTFLSAIHVIRSSAVENSQNLGENASSISSEAMIGKLEERMINQVQDKALMAEQKLSAYSDAVLLAASYAHTLLLEPDSYPQKEVARPLSKNAGTWTMQRALANEEIDYKGLQAQSALLGNMEDVFAPLVENSDNIATIYLGTENGLQIAYDPFSDGDAAEESYYEYRDSSWYELGKHADRYAFTDAYQDGYGRGLTITCVAPFTDANGGLVGCVAIDILMRELNASMVNDGIVDPSAAVLIDSHGAYIAGKDIDPATEDAGSVFDDDGPLSQAAPEILRRKNGITSVGTGEDAVYISFASIDSTDWILCIMSPVASVISPALSIRESINHNTEGVVATVTQEILNVIQYCLLLSALILLFVTLFAGRSSKKISDPLKQLEADVLRISGGNLDNRTQVVTDDEIGSLANSFNTMTDSLQRYIANLKEVTAKEERIAGELDVARHIQASMLPRDFEGFSAKSEFDLYASMTPAKEVGGDFYDFFYTDENHVCLVMADVSGKGVSAALFMAIAKTLIKNRAQMGGGPAEILSYANEKLCEGNEAELFVTVWLAIIDLTCGKGLAANAGHEHPVIRHVDGEYELVKYRHSPAVATMEGIRFREHEFELQPGDRFFVYTDGVAEATNATNELFGTERMLQALNFNVSATPKELLEHVKAQIDAFVGESDQFDDITMLSFYYYGPKEL